jgi:hypothetical protein
MAAAPTSRADERAPAEPKVLDTNAAPPVPDPAALPPDSPLARTPDRRAALAVAIGIVVLAVPLLIALAALREPRWYPTLDMAMTELRVRDVGGAHTPLIGLPGRIGTLDQQGSHPGPLSFWLITPTYRVLGSSAWAMQAGGVVLHVAALLACLLIAKRRGGWPLVVGVTFVLAELTRGYGTLTLTDPWNPLLPVLWWVVLLLAVWSVLCGDLPMLPVAVFAASFCAQTHVPYLALGLGLGALATGGAVVAIKSRWHEPAKRIRAIGWVVGAAAFGVLLWTAPLVDQFTKKPGNLDLLRDYLTNPPEGESTAGLVTGAKLMLLRLDPWHFLVGHEHASGSLVEPARALSGSLIPGALVVAVWVLAAVAAWRMRHGVLLRLHAVVGTAMVLGALSISRIFGHLWYYLMLWAWGITAVLLLAVGWTAVEAVRRRRRADTDAFLRIGGLVLAAATVSSAVVFAVGAVDAVPEARTESRVLGAMLGPTASALDSGLGPAVGRGGRYTVTWTDSLYIGAQGYGLVSELERLGFDVGAPTSARVPITRHRVIDPADANAVIVLASGSHIDEWRNYPGSVEVTVVDPRSPEELTEYEQLRTEAINQLEALGLDDVVPAVDGNLFGASIDLRVPRSTQDLLNRMLQLGGPEAIFLLPQGTTGCAAAPSGCG